VGQLLLPIGQIRADLRGHVTKCEPPVIFFTPASDQALEPVADRRVNLHPVEALAPISLASAVRFLYRVRPLKNRENAIMLETSLSQLEQLVNDLVQKNLDLAERNAQLSDELAQAKDENESLQLSLMEQEEKQGATAARIQALVERAGGGAVTA
jgi:cell division protein ZapB